MTVASQTTGTCPDQENARAAYAIAIELRMEASRGVWQRFNIMLLTNSIVLLGIVSALTPSDPLAGAALLLSLFGAFVSWLWLLRIRRARRRIIAYRDAILALEPCLPGITTFAQVQATRDAERSHLTRKLEDTWIEKIGAAELTVIPLTIIYGYLAWLALATIRR